MDKQQVYKAAKKYGHSAQNALEISIDYERGASYARDWVEVIAKEALK